MSSKKANDLLKALNSQIQHQDPAKPTAPPPAPTQEVPDKQPTQRSKANPDE